MARRHDKYYFEDGDVVFLVADSLFRVHKRVLTRSESSTFTGMFSVPLSSGTEAEGQSDENPIVLSGDSLEEFEALIRLLYPLFPDGPDLIPVVTYRAAMRIAVKYCMEDIQNGVVSVILRKTAWVGGASEAPGMALQQLGFIFEFPGKFQFSLAAQVLQATYTEDPKASDLVLLQSHPDVIAILLQFYIKNAKRHNFDATQALRGFGFIGEPPLPAFWE